MGKAISRAYATSGVGGLYASRKTFILDPQGRIAHIFEKVNTKMHDREVLDMVKKPKAKG
jgi:peroxiredoxin Q/BCP